MLLPAICYGFRPIAKLSGGVFFAGLAAFIFALMCASGSSRAAAGELNSTPARDSFIRADWQGPWSLPPRFRNHCSYDVNSGRVYCSNHCGIDYQFYYCSPASFGCCHPGYGYCNWKGHLRCAP